MLSPAEPTQTRFYVQDKLEFKDVVVQVGLSMESIDTGAMAPDSDGDGYGDSDGFNHLYFNRQRVDRNGDGNGNFVWKKTKKETATHPRIGISFPVSDRTVFRANYGTRCYGEHPQCTSELYSTWYTINVKCSAGSTSS